MNDIEPKQEYENAGARNFLKIFISSGDLLSNASEFPRVEGETAPSYSALIDYYLLGSSRTYVALAKHYDTQESPPTKSLATVRQWSHRYNWTERIVKYEEQVAQRQLAVLEQARMQFIGKQVGMLFTMEEAIQKAFPNIDYSDVNLAQFARAIEKFSDVTQKVFNMTPTVRVSHTDDDDSGAFRHLSANQALNQLAAFNEIIKQREELIDVVDGELSKAEDATISE